jgi:transposase
LDTNELTQHANRQSGRADRPGVRGRNRRVSHDIVANQPRGKEIHVIADKPSAHKSQPVKVFREAHKKVRLHFIPAYSSWLNQVGLWFSKIERDVIARGVFTSLPDLKRKLMRHIRHYNQTPKTVKWKYCRSHPTNHFRNQPLQSTRNQK